MQTDEFIEQFEKTFPDGDVRFIGFTGDFDTMRGTAEVAVDAEDPTRVVIDLWYSEDYGTEFRLDPRTAVALPHQWEVNSRGGRWAIRAGKPGQE